jgi:RHH-type proline utilization regulon transcriptional repressor/proline dehydrogenase/delta 1-pyrroline-5-carboxylate dehydrogenase
MSGPVIDAESKQRLDQCISRSMRGSIRFRWDRDHPLPASGLHFRARRHIFELRAAHPTCSEEVFGPILHVVRYPRARDAQTCSTTSTAMAPADSRSASIRASTTRVEQKSSNRLAGRQHVYVNRNMIGAVVGYAAVRRHAALRHRTEGRAAQII